MLMLGRDHRFDDRKEITTQRALWILEDRGLQFGYSQMVTDVAKAHADDEGMNKKTVGRILRNNRKLIGKPKEV